MDEQTKKKLCEAINSFLRDLIRIADEENYDRDSFVKASADMFATMAEISTFKEFDISQVGTCDGCKWKGNRHQKCSCCRRNKYMRDLWAGDGNG